MIRGIVLAAGASSRMGQAKAALPIGTTGETVAGRVVQTLLAAGLPSVTVVAGAHIDAVRAAMPANEPDSAGENSVGATAMCCARPGIASPSA